MRPLGLLVCMGFTLDECDALRVICEQWLDEGFTESGPSVDLAHELVECVKAAREREAVQASGETAA